MAEKLRILLVDDHEDTLLALEAALVPLGHPVERATGGAHALKAALKGGVGLVVMDVRMPLLSGMEVARYLRRLDQTCHIPIILVTGMRLDDDLTAEALEVGVADIISKPIDLNALRVKAGYMMRLGAERATAPRSVTTSGVP
ncbi:PleD family two-component system response regulator [Streptomyces sp. KL116D]|uniref:response regulator n=1 Tax=Streptomyces sp. KL116D TaxID=3045152 RepID=UPI0035590534